METNLLLNDYWINNETKAKIKISLKPVRMKTQHNKVSGPHLNQVVEGNL